MVRRRLNTNHKNHSLTPLSPPPHHLRQKMSLIVPEDEFNALLRILNTNVDGRQKVPFAMTKIRGVGTFARRLCCFISIAVGLVTLYNDNSQRTNNT
jgi:hypothetical protein